VATFELSASFLASSPDGSGPNDAELLEQILPLRRRLLTTLELSADAPVSIPLGNLAGAHYVWIEADHKVRVRLTSTDGATQALPADPLALVISQSVPITALDVTRNAGIFTIVKVFLGERQ